MQKFILTVKEAAGYFNIGEKKLRQLMDEHDDLVLMVGSRKLIKRTRWSGFLIILRAFRLLITFAVRGYILLPKIKGGLRFGKDYFAKRQKEKSFEKR